MQRHPRFRTGLAVLSLLFLLPLPTLAQERHVPDLVTCKEEVKAYYYSGRYEDDIREVVERATDYLDYRVETKQPDEKLAVVLDIDETSLSNWPEEVARDFGYDSDAFTAWVREAAALAIGPTFNFYNRAREHGVEVFFITGRRESLREVTVKNLEAAGYEGWAGLVLKPEDFGKSGSSIAEKYAAAYKSAARRKIAEDGYTIIISVGDQQSDLSGGFVEQGFKLPNPFYLIP